MTTDDLGSPRIVTNQLGQVVSRHDYLPFGEEVLAGAGGRSTLQGYGGNDGVRKQFTGYERDTESGLDYAQARYFKAGHGRFTSVDPLAASASIKNPQTLNRYTYGLNSPYKFTDPLGLAPCGNVNSSGTFGDACTQADDLENQDKKKDCPPKCTDGQVYIDDDGNEQVWRNDLTKNPGTGILASVTVMATYEAISTFATQVFSNISFRPLISFGITGVQVVGAPAIILTAAQPGGSACQVATGDMFCGTRDKTDEDTGTTVIPAPPLGTPLNRGRIQIQGAQPAVERSWPWASATPPTKAQGLAALNLLWNGLTRRQQQDRGQAFIRAQNFINSCPAVGCGPTSQTFQSRNPRDPQARIDIQIFTGTAFVY